MSSGTQSREGPQYPDGSNLGQRPLQSGAAEPQRCPVLRGGGEARAGCGGPGPSLLAPVAIHLSMLSNYKVLPANQSATSWSPESPGPQCPAWHLHPSLSGPRIMPSSPVACHIILERVRAWSHA